MPQHGPSNYDIKWVEYIIVLWQFINKQWQYMIQDEDMVIDNEIYLNYLAQYWII